MWGSSVFLGVSHAPIPRGGALASPTFFGLLPALKQFDEVSYDNIWGMGE